MGGSNEFVECFCGGAVAEGGSEAFSFSSGVLMHLLGLFAFEGVGVLGGDSACRGRVGVEVFR